jgi:hypothetical protein
MWLSPGAADRIWIAAGVDRIARHSLARCRGLIAIGWFAICIAPAALYRYGRMPPSRAAGSSFHCVPSLVAAPLAAVVHGLSGWVGPTRQRHAALFPIVFTS